MPSSLRHYCFRRPSIFFSKQTGKKKGLIENMSTEGAKLKERLREKSNNFANNATQKEYLHFLKLIEQNWDANRREAKFDLKYSISDGVFSMLGNDGFGISCQPINSPQNMLICGYRYTFTLEII